MFRRLRDVMAREQTAQSRLDRFVRIIAANVVAEVCAIYLRRAGDDLELFAAQGLSSSAVHKTRLHHGEGLVGAVADTMQPINLADAAHDPRFAYRPETGEDPYRSFLGVPILRGGRVIGVLTIQNKAARLYSDDEVESMQTIAMVLAEIAASGELIDPREFEDVEKELHRPERVFGSGLADGVAIGHAVFHEPPINASNLFTDDADLEDQRLLEGIRHLRNSVDELLSAHDLALPEAPRDILETYRLFAHDRGWVDRLRAAIASGLTAEAAVERVKTENRVRMSGARDPYLRERLHDLDDLAHRLLRHLTHGPNAAHPHPAEVPDDAILFARSLGPAELLEFDRSKLRGVVLGEGSAASHVAIVARALGLPLVGRAGDALDETDLGDLVVIDGQAGEVRIRPVDDVVDAYREQIELRSERQRAYSRLKKKPARTKDGVNIEILLNAGLRVDMPHLKHTNADGVGLFRTEIQFMVAPGLPRLKAQTDFYREVLESCAEKRLIFRTVDLGGDKVLPYLQNERESNPSMGWRAIRFALDRPALLRYQMRAMLEAAKGRELNIMFPMIAVVEEFEAARILLDKEIDRRTKAGRTQPKSLQVGVMIEVPSLAMQIDAILPLVDFVSVGGNDLAQFFFAADRDNARVQKRYDSLHPAFLRLVGSMAEKADAAGKPLTFCGEQGGRPIEAMALMGCGVTRFSMAATSVGPVKRMILDVDLAELKSFMAEALPSSRGSLREALNSFAARRGVNI